MNKQFSLSMFSKSSLSSIKLPMGITIRQLGLITVSIILLALAIYFVIAYFGAVGNRTQVTRDINVKQEQINSIGGLQNIAALQSQLEEAQQDLITDNPFPPELDNLEVVYLILEAASDANIDCLTYSSSKGSDYIGNNAYTANTYALGSQGEGSAGVKMNRIIRFLSNIEELPFNAVKIDGLSLSSISDEGWWGFTFTLTILSQQ